MNGAPMKLYSLLLLGSLLLGPIPAHSEDHLKEKKDGPAHGIKPQTDKFYTLKSGGKNDELVILNGTHLDGDEGFDKTKPSYARTMSKEKLKDLLLTRFGSTDEGKFQTFLMLDRLDEETPLILGRKLKGKKKAVAEFIAETLEKQGKKALFADQMSGSSFGLQTGRHYVLDLADMFVKWSEGESEFIKTDKQKEAWRAFSAYSKRILDLREGTPTPTEVKALLEDLKKSTGGLDIPKDNKSAINDVKYFSDGLEKELKEYLK